MPVVPRDETKPRRVLVVDDHEAIRMLLRRFATKMADTVIEASDGDEALAILRNDENLDAVLMDVMMPGRTGFEVIQALRAEEKATYTPIILVTAEETSDDINRGFSVGADDYVVKPPREQDIAMRLRSAFRIRDLATALRQHVDTIERDLSEARDLQRQVMPPAQSEGEHLRFASVFHPCLFVAGDMLNYFRLTESHWGVYVADVSGHGVPAAMLSLWVNRVLQPTLGKTSIVKEVDAQNGAGLVSPDRVCAQLNQLLCSMDCDRFLTIAYLVVDEKTGVVTYCVGGHPDVLWQRSDGTIQPLTAGGPPPGLDDGEELPFDMGQVTLSPGDRIFVYSDGIPEAVSLMGELFGDVRLHEALQSSAGASLGGQLEAIMSAVGQHRGNSPQDDDVTLLGVEWRGPAT